MTSFFALGLTDDVNRAISESGYEKPTEIQAQMIPVIRDGHDAIGLSQTGSGKTAAFVLPLLDHLVKTKKRARRGSCSVLVLSPTRELSNQIADTVRGYGRYVNYAQTVVVGGVSYPPQVKALKRGMDIVIATPGRILDHIENDVISMDETSVIVLDEADQMLDFGFFPVIRKIMATLPEKRQTILTSATMPKAIKDLTKEFMTKPVTIEATPESRPVETIQQQIIYVEKQRKNMALLEIVSQKDAERTIVFTRTKFGAERVQKFLNNYGVLAVSLHGNKSQGQRQRALRQFRSGEAEVLVATDVAGRGIDIDDITHVVNVDLPNIPESYVHRIGRTGRAGRQGIAISFCSKPERGYLKDIEKLIGTSLPKRDDKPGAVPIKPVSTDPVDMDRMEDETLPGRSRKARSGESRSRSSRPPRSTRKKDQHREKPRSGKPRSASFEDEKSRSDRPYSDRPRRQKPRFDEVSSDRQYSDWPRSDKPRSDKPRSDRPRHDKPRSDKPREYSQDRDTRYSRDGEGKAPFKKKPFKGKPSAKGKGPSDSRSDRRSGHAKSAQQRITKGKSSGGKPHRGRRFADTAEQGLKRKSRG